MTQPGCMNGLRHGSDLNAEMKKKLIEVALPLEAINKEAAREKSIRHGHPSTLHLWWARRPLAACRAILFASLVDDPSSRPEEFPTEAGQDGERQRLFRLLEELVKWENSNNKNLLDAAHREILKSTDGNPPPVYDPFCGGGSIPLEAQRLGLEAQASDLNPVAVLITKAMIEIPPKFSGQPPVHPIAQGRMSGAGMWEGAYGLAEDVRYYGQWMRERALGRIGHLYPKVQLPGPQGGEATAIVWLWARTVKCPNPACNATMPLMSSFALSTKPGKKAWIEPVVNHSDRTVRFEVRTGDGNPPDPPKVGRGAKFRCLVCQQIAPDQHIKDEGAAGRMGQQLTAIAAEGQRGRVYMAPSSEQEVVAASASPAWGPEQDLAYDPRNVWCVPYGLRTYRDLFTARQLLAVTTFSDLLIEVRQQAIHDGASTEYAAALITYLSFAVDRAADAWSSLVGWRQTVEATRSTFARQALPMVWDFAEANPFSGSCGNWTDACVEWVLKALESLPAKGVAHVSQLDSAAASSGPGMPMFCTDPPYYDNISYANLSDFFYVWMRKALADVYPQLLSTLLVPKAQEMIANPYRFEGNKDAAQAFFEEQFGKSFVGMRSRQNPDYPMSVFYAFKQTETDDDLSDSGENVGTVSTGWETMLGGLLASGFQITATWPMRSEKPGRSISVGTNALASSIILACRPRPDSAGITTRKDFLASMKRELPSALKLLQKGNIAPVDLAQAAIGPGMAVFSRYRKVLESDGSSMRVRTALGLINQTLDEVLSEQEGEFDPDTRWALAWFEQHAFEEGPYGEAEVLATAKALSVSVLDETKILQSRAGKVRLLRRAELSENWNPSAEHRLTVWAVTQHLIRSLDKNGETATAALASKVGGLAETARDLAYRLYILSERKGWAEEAGYYNSLVVSWPAIAPKAFALS
jgi:putative DNA methylase